MTTLSTIPGIAQAIVTLLQKYHVQAGHVMVIETHAFPGLTLVHVVLSPDNVIPALIKDINALEVASHYELVCAANPPVPPTPIEAAYS